MESIQFGCTLCGECCSGSMKIFVNSQDLYKMARFLELNHSRELFDRHFLILDRGQNGLDLPRIRFKTKPFPFCPFLINDVQEDGCLRGLCSLHRDHKPLICRLAPLNRELDLETGEETFGFKLPYPGCPGSSEPRTLNKAEELAVLSEELANEKRYYRLLSQNREPHFLWNFPLDKSFDEILRSWEQGGRS